jgi:hypothetical protein
MGYNKRLERVSLAQPGATREVSAPIELAMQHSRPWSILLFALLLALHAFVLPQNASAAVMTKRVHSGVAGVDFIVSCAPGPIAADYQAETGSGVKLTDPYAVQRGADKGLVTLMSEGRRRTKQYIIPQHLIRAIISVRYDETVPDRVDLVFTRKHLVLIHISTASAGIFTESDVYQLAYSGGRGVDRKPLQDNQELLQMLDLGLSFYQPRNATCGS